MSSDIEDFNENLDEISFADLSKIVINDKCKVTQCLENGEKTIGNKRNLKRKLTAKDPPKSKMKSTENNKSESNKTNKEHADMVNAIFDEIGASLEYAMYRCQSCNIICFNKIEHLFESHIDESTECPLCEHTYPVKDIKNHLRTCQQLIAYQCNICNGKFDHYTNCHKHSLRCDGKDGRDSLSVADGDDGIGADTTSMDDVAIPRESSLAMSTVSESVTVVPDRPHSTAPRSEMGNIEIRGDNDTCCAFCTMSFPDKRQLEHHCERDETVVWRCVACERIYPTELCVEAHLKIDHRFDYRTPKKILYSDNDQGLTLEQMHIHNSVRKRLLNQCILDAATVKDNVRSAVEMEWHKTWDEEDCDSDQYDDRTTVNNSGHSTMKRTNGKQNGTNTTTDTLSIDTSVRSHSICQSSIHNDSNGLDTYQPMFDNLAQQFLSDTESITTDDFDVFAKVINQSEVKNVLLREDEQLLQHILPMEIEANTVDLDRTQPMEIESGLPLLSTMKTLMNKPVLPIAKNDNDELIKLAKKKRVAIDRENKREEAKKNAQLAKENELTYKKLINMETRTETIIELELEKIMNKLESETTTCDDLTVLSEDILFSDECYLEQNEIDKILAICEQREFVDGNNITVAMTITEYTDQNNHKVKSTDAIYNCHNCGAFTTKSYSDFYHHLSNHNREIVLKNAPRLRMNCMICGVIVPQLNFVDHVKMHRDHISCATCQNFVHQEKWNAHVSDHAKHLRCSICGEIYKTRSAIIKHFTHHRTGVSYSCYVCKFKFASLEKLVCHICHAHQSIGQEYAECPYCFELTDNIKNHIYSAGLCKLKCKTCIKVLNTEKDYINHLKEHAAGKGQREVLNVEKRMFTCTICGLRLTKKIKLEHHVHCHKIDSMYLKHFPKKSRAECDICKTVMLSSYLQYHVKKHQYYERCQKCFKFILKSNIVEHREMHQYDFQCGKCAEVFPDQRKLEDHEWAHGRLLQRPCNDCHLVFNSEVTRMKHWSFVHRNIDPEFVECHYCNELLMGEIEFHLLDPNYCQRRCKLCDTRFKTADGYQSHMMKDHLEFMETHRSCPIEPIVN